jgi:hypothetical protein
MKKQTLEIRRHKVVRELEQVNRKIAATEKRLVQIQTRLSVQTQGRPKVA